MYNIHFHIFDYKCVPDKFIPVISDWLLDKPKRIKRWVWFMRNINPLSDNDMFDRYAAFLATMNQTQQDILNDQRENYPPNTMLTPLTVDMENMGRGYVKTPYITQVRDIITIAEDDLNVRPFIMIDPRSQWLDDLYGIIKENSELISGIKLYPLMGYYPDDERLFRFYELASELDMAVVMHCTPNNAVYYSGKDIDSLLRKDDEFYFKAKNNKNKCGNFTHPSHLARCAEYFPNVNFSFAHFGGNEEWRDLIFDYIVSQDNLWTDVSFTFDTKKELQWLKIALENNNKIGTRVLYGDDYYMPQKVNTETFYNKCKDVLGEDLFCKISDTNPRNYLRF